MVKVKLGKPLKLPDTSVKIRDRELRFVFDKYGDNSLVFELTNLFGRLNNSGYSKSQKGDFVQFILKKEDKIKWKNLHSDLPPMSKTQDNIFNMDMLTGNNKNSTNSFQSNIYNLRCKAKKFKEDFSGKKRSTN